MSFYFLPKYLKDDAFLSTSFLAHASALQVACLQFRLKTSHYFMCKRLPLYCDQICQNIGVQMSQIALPESYLCFAGSSYFQYNFLIHCKPIPCNKNRVFPVKFSHREIPVMKTGVPAMRTGVPCNENRFFPVWKTSQGKPCSGPVLAL